jgi:chromate transporter
VSSINVPSFLLTLAAVIAIFRFRAGMIQTLLAVSLAGIVWHMGIELF